MIISIQEKASMTMGISNLFTLVTNPCKFKTKKTEWFLDSERNS